MDAAYTEESRNLGFRRTVLDAYDHHCAFCGARIRTPSGRSAAQAAHIVPFSVCRNNDPRNGLSLCPLHHWAFDQGMLCVNRQRNIEVHKYALEMPADASFVALHKKSILHPSKAELAPSPLALDWHRREVFKTLIN